MAKMGRPRKEINQKQFEQACGMQCTLEEICAFFDVTDKTLDSWCKRTYHKTFSEVFKEKRSVGKMSLRRSQWKLAETNPTLSIWLGKQYLGQKDNKDIYVKQSISQEAISDVEEFMNFDGSTAAAAAAIIED